MSYSEDQEDEREVLRSIYEADERFNEVNATTFQYKFGEDGHYKSFLLEISWPPNYPTSLPVINLDAFYNKHINCKVKESIRLQVVEQCEMCLGSAMTYSIFDWAKEHEEELMQDQQEQVCRFCLSIGAIHSTKIWLTPPLQKRSRKVWLRDYADMQN